LMLSSSHPGPTVVEIFSKPEMRKNSKESLTEVNIHGNLKNIIRV
jgi:glycerol-3-phosphate dehydrogenase